MIHPTPAQAIGGVPGVIQPQGHGGQGQGVQGQQPPAQAAGGGPGGVQLQGGLGQGILGGAQLHMFKDRAKVSNVDHHL